LYRITGLIQQHCLGPKALWEGLLKLMAYVEAFQVAREVYGEG
jgi:hypothetical protein